MSVFPVLALRQAAVRHLRADLSVTGTGIADRLFGERVRAEPTWPFARCGMIDAAGEDGVMPWHIFSKDDFTDDVNGIAEAIGKSLDGATLQLGDGQRAYLTWQGVMLAGDRDEASAWHATVRIGVRVPRSC
jgi:hypothetical protein